MGNLCKITFKEDIDIIAKRNSPREKLKIKEIDQLKKKIMNIPIFERDNIAKKKYEILSMETNINNKGYNFFNNYIKILELLFLNDTDKNNVQLYLNFIKSNEQDIKKYKLKLFDEEIEKYKILFTVKEMTVLKTGIKLQSEKERFVDFLEKLYNVENNKDIEKIYNEINSIQIQYFNYPIEFTNQELFYYKLYIIVIIQIRKIKNSTLFSEEEKYDYIFNKRDVVKIIKDNKILENEKIIKNENKMNILLMLILYEKIDNNGESINFNRLLQIEKVEYKELITYINNNNIGEITEIDYKNVIHLKNKYIGNEIKEIYANDVCIKNLNKEELDNICDINKFNTLDSLLNKNDVTPYIKKIKIFLIKIINSKVYKEAITKLFPKNYKNLLGENLKDIKTCINQRFKFYPYQGLGHCGVTDKFSCYSYICVLFNIFSSKKYYPTLRSGAIIDISLHEINHLNQDILYFIGKDRNLFDTPKREDLKGDDGGEHLEEILFGRKIGRLKMLECFYLLNENNYNQSLNDFRSNFENLYKNSNNYSEKIKYLKNDDPDAIFKEIFDNIKNYKEKDFKKIELYGINTKPQIIPFDEMLIYLPKDFCKMGA